MNPDDAPDMPGPAEAHRMDVRLSYADCDPAQIIYFGAWFAWMERVQTEWMFLNNLEQPSLQSRYGFRVVTRSTSCEYLARATLFEVIRVSMRAEHLGRTSVRWGFDMTRSTDQVLVARGTLSLVAIDDAGVPTEVPQPLRGLVEALLPSVS